MEIEGPDFVKATGHMVGLISRMYGEISINGSVNHKLETAMWKLAKEWFSHAAKIADDQFSMAKGCPELYTPAQIRGMDQDELADVVEDQRLDVDLTIWRTLAKKQQEVIDALKKKGVLEPPVAAAAE